MYRIEFNGVLLPGFDPQIVRMDVAVRLRLQEKQVDRLFTGKTVVLKKAVAEASSQAYLTELRGMGLDARLVPLAQEEAPRKDGSEFKAVFWGRLLPGFERTAVMAAAAKRLRVSPAQLMQMFSGSKVVLKRGITGDQGSRLVVGLALIGMQIELEMEQAAPEAAAALEAQTPASEGEDDPQFGALLRTACDLSGTAFSGYDVSSNVAHEEPAEEMPVPVMPPPPARRGTEGYASANQDGYLNCPRCGLYQPQAAQCTKCGVELPARRPYGGRQPVFHDAAPTTLVTPAEAARPYLSPQERPRAKGPSLHTLMEEQELQEEETPARRARLPLLIAAAVVVAALAWGLMR
ncbi:hypothetical protein [Uliginosibacterium aquaticum]|uniref:Zinc ribbon domain-containing protein n=1 Tax=Uliginosibacterium aquaticum TaxID=2731212 RepID=A0ABX2IJC3_9RHOO|nr:hypothetical protein [Uliginosibacterium aquaticum]NSL56901.1 hypothetical protein [Uliginosibacterium aquaticum]